MLIRSRTLAAGLSPSRSNPSAVERCDTATRDAIDLRQIALSEILARHRIEGQHSGLRCGIVAPHGQIRCTEKIVSFFADAPLRLIGSLGQLGCLDLQLLDPSGSVAGLGRLRSDTVPDGTVASLRGQSYKFQHYEAASDIVSDGQQNTCGLGQPTVVNDRAYNP